MKKKIASEFNSETGTLFSISVKKKLLSKKTKYQKIEIYHSETHGNVLMLDGCFMFTERDCLCYHDKCNELMTRKKYFQDILIIGGGDFGLVKKLSYRKDIRSITVVEIDKEVISSCRKFFPEFFKISQNFMKKIKIIYTDGYEWAKNNCNRKFDTIVIDSTDPVGCAKKLFTKRFFGYTFGMLNSGGIYIQQSGSPIIHYEKIIQPMIKQLSVIGFKKITINPFSMPSYPLGIWSFVRCQRRSN